MCSCILPVTAGAASHAVDYRRSAGGFIHGYRYNCRALYKHLEWRYNGVQWPFLTIDAVDLTDHIIKRVNEASVSDCVSMSTCVCIYICSVHVVFMYTGS